MPKILGFVVDFLEYSDRPYLFNRGSAKFLGWRVEIAWNANTGEQFELAREFFETARTTVFSRDMFRLVETEHHVPAAKDCREEFSRMFSRQPAGSYSYTETHLHITPNKAAEYRMRLENKAGDDAASAMREFLDRELVFQAVFNENARFLEVRIQSRPEGHSSLTRSKIEVLRSPLQKKFSRRQHNQ